MREIKFRGQRVDTKEWVFGDLNQLQSRDLIHGFEYCQRVSYEVIPETVGQFTGLKDKNGKKIYEGDSVRSYKSVFRDVVEWSYLLSGWFPFASRSDIYFADECEIAGNIHDNPELLKGETK